MTQIDHVGLWNRCLEIIKDNVPESAFKTWFLPIVPLEYKEETLVLQVPTQFFYEFLEDKYIHLLKNAIYKVYGIGTKLNYKVMVVKGVPIELPSENNTTESKPKEKKKEIPAPPAVADIDPCLKAGYNFDTFIEGESNKLSRSVAEAVALNPAKTIFNPLFFHGASGVGKTHLANAIGTKIKELYPEKRVLYVSAHLFQVQYTDSVRNNTTNDFLNFYQKIDVLIVDDIQEFAGVTRTQNTFFHIFNHLHQNGKQLILTSDRAPSMLQGIEERMLTRFKWGMVAELEKPTVELRKNILLNKIRRDGLQFPMEVVDFIAENVSDSVRDLEGIIIAILAHSTILNKNIDLDLAKRVIQRNISNIENKTITIDEIIKAVCTHFNIEADAIYTKSRKREVVQARQIAMYLAKNNTELSTAKIGAQIGGKDHATVLHACKTIKEQREVDKCLREDVDKIQASLRK